MNELESEQNSSGTPPCCSKTEQDRPFSPVSRLQALAQNLRPQHIMDQFRAVQEAILESHLFSVWLFLLAMPVFGVAIQCILFLFGITCSPFPMWFSFLVFSALALLIGWKTILKFWGLVFLALFFTTYTFSYLSLDAEYYHFPMQFLLREGWNPVFDSTLEKFAGVVNPFSLKDYHTLFLPKTVALCGALVALSTGLWIADSFLGYALLFVLFRTAFVFAKQQWKCHWTACLLFAVSISFSSTISEVLGGRVDYNTYAALLITIFSMILYLRHRCLHDFILAIIVTLINCTIKSTGLINSIVLWGLFGLYSWKREETYWGITAVVLLVVLIGFSPYVTSWVQYGSPYYPQMTFDPKLAPVDMNGDFRANADGEQMGYLARLVYAWVSPALATKACSIFYHKPDFHPVFVVNPSVDGLRELDILLCASIVLLLLAKKDLVTIFYFYILITLTLCPLRYIGYERYFPQAWALIPIGIFQFCSFPPSWLAKRNKLKLGVRYALLLILCVPVMAFCLRDVAFQAKYMIMEGQKQKLLSRFKEEGSVFLIPSNTTKGFTTSQRLICANVDYSFSQQKMDMKHFEEDTSFPHFKEYYLDFWRSDMEYPVCNTPTAILRFKWLDLFKYFPRPLFYQRSDISKSIISKTPESPEQAIKE